MKKLVSLFTILLLCIAMVGCTQRIPELKPEPKPDAMPQVPGEIFAVTKITDVAMTELRIKLSGMDVNDFIHQDRLAQFEAKGISVDVQNIQLANCNTITFDIVLWQKMGPKLVLPATGMLMYQYWPEEKECIEDLQVLWGNIAINIEQIAFLNINTMSVWNAETFEKAFRQPDMSFVPDDGIYFLLDVVKAKDGYMLPYFSQSSSGFVHISEMGKIVTTPVQQSDRNYTMFGQHSVQADANYNTTARPSNLLHCFYGDESEEQLFVALDYVYGYYGNDYTMYDFENGMFVHSYNMARVDLENVGFSLYGMADYSNKNFVSKGTLLLVERKVDGKVESVITFRADVTPLDFGQDNYTGWNTAMFVDVSEDLNTINFGCKKSGMVITADFSTDTAQIVETTKMPVMNELASTSTGMHKMYSMETDGHTSVVVRCLSGYCEIDWIANVQGKYGTDWLAGFTNEKHKQYAYTLTKDLFVLYRWDGSNKWDLIAYINGGFDITKAKATQLCNIYKY